LVGFAGGVTAVAAGVAEVVEPVEAAGVEDLESVL